MRETLEARQDLQGTVGRLHIPGVTIGDNPFESALKAKFAKWGYDLDSLNWIYWKKYPTDTEALVEMSRLDTFREGLARSWFKSHRKLAENLHFRVMQDPDMGEYSGAVETF